MHTIMESFISKISFRNVLASISAELPRMWFIGHSYPCYRSWFLPRFAPCGLLALLWTVVMMFAEMGKPLLSGQVGVPIFFRKNRGEIFPSKSMKTIMNEVIENQEIEIDPGVKGWSQAATGRNHLLTLTLSGRGAPRCSEIIWYQLGILSRYGRPAKTRDSLFILSMNL